MSHGHAGAIMRIWRSNHEASWTRKHGGGIIEKTSGGIWKASGKASERYLGSIWETSGKHLRSILEVLGGIWGASGRHLGGIWGASGRHPP